MKKLVLPLNIIFLGLSLACDTALIITHLYPIKITASVFFMLAATVNLIYALKYFPDKKLPSVILTVGVFFAMSADIAINLNFIAGAAIFALGLLFHSIFADAKAPSDRLYPRNYNIYPHSAVYDVLTAS